MKQSSLPPRKAEMPRGKPLARTGGLSRAEPQGTARRRTGFSPKVKLMARTRAGGGDPRNARCEAHGGSLDWNEGDYQHRLARGMGGCSDALVNSVENCALLCRACHELAEARDPGMEARGWWIRRGNGPRHDPRHVPVMVMSESGSGALQYLTSDGGYSSAPPAGVAA